MTIKELAVLIHQNAVEKGFWEDTPNINTLFALMHSEASEMLEFDRAGTAFDPDEKLPQFAKAEVELADIIIRALDVAEGLNLPWPPIQKVDIATMFDAKDMKKEHTTVGAEAGKLHLAISMIHSLTKKVNDPQLPLAIGYLLLQAEATAFQFDWRIAYCILAKHEYNRSRPYKHGKKF